jgi:hypothetical protein
MVGLHFGKGPNFYPVSLHRQAAFVVVERALPDQLFDVETTPPCSRKLVLVASHASPSET